MKMHQSLRSLDATISAPQTPLAPEAGEERLDTRIMGCLFGMYTSCGFDQQAFRSSWCT